MPEPKRRLTSEDWIDAGLDALASEGPQALKAEPLARKLGTTKGSFYWHFKDVPDFQTRVLTRWKERGLAVLSESGADETTTERLYRFARPDEPEGAIRGWARVNHTAADVVTEIDRHRHVALTGELAALGLTNPEFAQIVQAAVIGMEALGSTETLSTLMAAILALQEA